jgi:HD-GYP domain-containing protein (c-di-GMP phosphodiesterase class II)
MIEKIAVEDLRIGMFIHNLNCSWMKHNFVRNQFLIEDAATLAKIRAIGVAEVYVNSEYAVDMTPAASEERPAETAAGNDSAEVAGDATQGEPSAFVAGIIAKLSPAEGFAQAKLLYSNANLLMQGMMKDVRLGKQIDLEACDPMVDHIIDSMFSFPSALLPLAQIKSRDEYTYQHSVSVCALAVAFGRVLDLPRQEIKELAMGAMLHDVGKAKIPGKILNKSGRLDQDEFSVMKQHVVGTAALLKGVDGVSEIAFNAAAQHHERFDGTGYPHGLKGDQISLHGQMLAIVDVYDAITSIRVYHKGMPPTEALRKLFEWSGTHFNHILVRAFTKGIGIYPAGSLVRMESEKLGIVREVVPDKLLQPVVELIYDCRKSSLIRPELVNLSASNDKIKSHESFEAWGINQAKWQVAGSR